MNDRLRGKDKLSLWQLAWPIALEMFLQFLMGTADTLMVSRVSDHAVSAVGLSTQVLNATNVMFMMINAGAGIIIAQKLGAGEADLAKRTAAAALKANLVVGALLSMIMFFSAEWMLRVMQAPEDIIPMAVTYLSMVGAGAFILSLNAAMSSIIRNTGNTKGPMLIVMGMNALHLVLNYLLIFGAFGFPQWGIFGVAVSTLVSRFVALFFNFILLRRSFEPGFSKSDWKGWDLLRLKEVWRIGWPMSVNAASWNFTQAVIFAVIASMGSATLASFTYMNTIQSLPWLVGMSMAIACQIRVGHLYGARNFDDCYRSAYSALWGGISYVTVCSLLLVLVGQSLLGQFTSDAEVIRIAVPLLAINVLLQPLKMVNQAFSFPLNGIGDTRYTALTNMLSMWLVAAGCTYWFGISLGWGIIGVYAAMICDEAIRGVLVIHRWRKRGRLPSQAEGIVSSLS
jgi:putative MATE family efflux protein